MKNTRAPPVSAHLSRDGHCDEAQRNSQGNCKVILITYSTQKTTELGELQGVCEAHEVAGGRRASDFVQRGVIEADARGGDGKTLVFAVMERAEVERPGRGGGDVALSLGSTGASSGEP